MSDVKTGHVFLVGAGPGHPGLITMRGVECLRQADVVLYDYLVNPRILLHARNGAERICLGQHGRTRLWTQDEINQRMVADARAGRTVVRLKGGDPIVFARAADELEVLSQEDIPFEVVPGVTAALAAGSYAGIPITHRDFASAVALVTGQESPHKQGPSLDFHALAHFPGTLVVYMGVTTAPKWTQALLDAGKPKETPVALIRRCSWPDQQVVQCRLDEVVSQLSPYRRFPPPVIAIIGPVADLARTLAWTHHAPLFGQRIMVTRPLEQAAALEQRLVELGADVVIQPAIQITPPANWDRVDDCVARLSDLDWVIFVSANGVQMFLERMMKTGRDMRSLGGVRVAAIGPGTAAALQGFHLEADLVPDKHRAESLAADLADQVSGCRVLIIRASRGREVLAETLAECAASVEQCIAYQSLDVEQPAEAAGQLMSEGRIDWVTVTSSAIARSLARMFGEDLQRARLASISPLTSEVLRGLGYTVAAEAEDYTMDGVVAAIVQSVAAQGGAPYEGHGENCH